ncbi:MULTISPECIES: ABC transporter permease [Actinomyces]|uniref:Transport permease protein n=1 Tax=Actinomyces respiraculi TaxID=2744574 RepID=A0A7T0PXT0_9ACTO|nr:MULTISPECIES: ABC transporter permease [Actinomyces]QPL05935.1 ABC transporter permease [Actinomyces respiraculi]
MRAYKTLTVMLIRSSLRDPIGLFFSIVFAPLLVAILGAVFGNDPMPQFGNRGFVDAILPACVAMVMGMTGFILLPVNQLQARESGALGRLRATPLSPQTLVAADLTVNAVISLVGVILALLVGSLGFGATPSGSAVGVLGAVVLGLTAFLTLGYALAAIYPGPKAANGIGNGLFLTSILTSGAFIPTADVPASLERIQKASPSYYLSELLRGQWTGQPWSQYTTAVAVLMVMTVVCAALGARLFKWGV